MNALPKDYEERVYAGVLGKIIAVYLGRPFEGWRYQRIVAELGDIAYYVNDRHDLPLKNHLLVVTDDDISGTFVFPRALRDHSGGDPTPQQIGRTWLNYIVEDETVLWWGGVGNSTEHTAYLRMRDGILPPESGSIARNGKVVAEQVGAQIFVEGFAMARPGDPEAAADLATRAASVSHDGEALNAARVVAALVAGAFAESDMDKLLDTASSLIAPDSLIRRVIDDVREWSGGGSDWKATRERIAARYGYDRYPGNCHVVPNHALVICALAHSRGDFARAMTIINTSGWDTDSNAGNVGAITGIRGGLAGLDSGPDWRGPVADRMYLPGADGGAVITDAAREASAIAAVGRLRHGQEPVIPKDGARFHFSFTGSVQGFRAEDAEVEVTHSAGRNALSIGHPGGGHAIQVTTPTFIPPEAITMPIYGLLASPTLYPGQQIRARTAAGTNTGPVACRLLIKVYDGREKLRALAGSRTVLAPDADADLLWTVPDLDGQPIAAVGLEITAVGASTVYLDHLTWDGAPDVTLTRPADGGHMWRRAWVRAVDRYDDRWPEPFRIVQNRGTGLLIQGSREWRDYEVTADVTPHLATGVGVAARVQGLLRYYALELTGRDTLRLVKVDHGNTEILGTAPYPWEFGSTYTLTLRVAGTLLRAAVDREPLIEVEDAADPMDCGGVALLVKDGRTATQAVRIRPI